MTALNNRRYADEDSASDSDAPEVVPMAQGKAAAKKQELEVQNARTDARRKLKDANRRKDAKLKQRAEDTRVQRGDRDDKEGASAVSRMEKAMLDAEGEESNSEDERDDGLEEEKGIGSSSATGESMDEDEEDSEFGGFGDETDFSSGSKRSHRPSNAKYLPDEVFESALSSLANSIQVMRKDKLKDEKKVDMKTVRRKSKSSHRSSTKDIIFGTKIIRTMPPRTADLRTIDASRTVPSKNAKHFIRKALALKTDHSARIRRNGWERRAANVGSLQSRSGLPAARFVRTT